MKGKDSQKTCVRHGNVVTVVRGNMREEDTSPSITAPTGFAEEVERAVAEKQLGDLGLLGAEAKGFSWESEGLRIVRRAQDRLHFPRTEDMQKGKRVLVFTGHMIDAPVREKPRFPPDKEDVARRKIKEAVQEEMKAGKGVSFGIAGGASGGDILFHEVCAELGIQTHLYLALRSHLYVNASVRPAGPEWMERFRHLHTRLSDGACVRVLSEVEEEPKDEKEYLPAWLRSKPDYNIWQRSNLWMLHNALSAGGDKCVTLIALWDCEPTGDGPGGTSDLVQQAQTRGAKTIVINTKKEFEI
jgi:hypothetical protein